MFVDASDRAEAKKHLYQRLAEEWRCSVNRITFHNMWNENELREMSTGPREPAGLPLLESGGGNGGVFYDHEPLLLIASRRLRASLETALIVLQKWTVCVGCGYSGVRDSAGKNAPVWVKVSPESGLGLCSGCDSFLLQERQRRQRHDQLFSCGLSCKQRKTEGAV
ncbi:hypothetical protein E8R62_004759 [Escherichia coli]|nr:hypothetical protein [Escherichia coli]